MDRYTITVLVPEPFATSLAAMRKQYDLFTRQWLPPHMTLIPPFELSLSRDDVEFIRHMPVNVTASFDGWDAYRRSVTSVLYLKTKSEGPNFSDVIEKILSGLPKLAPFRPQDFNAHVTVVSRIPNEQFSEVESTVTKNVVEGSFTVDRLMLYRWDDVVRRWIAVTM